MSLYSYTEPTFKPAFRYLTWITQSSPMLVTTDVDHLYTSGLIVKLIVPHNYGMTQANDFQGEITVISATEFTMPVDATGFDMFSLPAGTIQIRAQVVPVGEVAEMLTEAERNVLPY